MYLCYVSDILTLISLVSLITATYQGKDYNGQETQQSHYETEKPGNTTSLYKMDFSPLATKHTKYLLIFNLSYYRL